MRKPHWVLMRPVEWTSLYRPAADAARRERSMKEIKFKNVGVDLKGKQNGMAFSILLDYERVTTGGPAYYVGVHSDTGDFPWLSTWGHRYFDADSAKEFCRRIAAGKIDVEALRAEFAAEDAARERAASRPAIPECSHTKLLSADYSPTSAHLVFTHEGDAAISSST